MGIYAEGPAERPGVRVHRGETRTTGRTRRFCYFPLDVAGSWGGLDDAIAVPRVAIHATNTQPDGRSAALSSFLETALLRQHVPAYGGLATLYYHSSVYYVLCNM